MKKGISAVVATVLTVLITVAAVTIIWVGILPMIQDDVGVSNLEGRLDIVSSEGYTVYDSVSGNVTVQVKRGVGGDEIVGIELVVTFGGDSKTLEFDVVPDAGGTLVYEFSMVDIFGEIVKPDSVKVVPIFVGGKRGVATSVLNVFPEGDASNVEGVGGVVVGGEVVCVLDLTCEDWDDSTEDYRCGGECDFVDILNEEDWYHCAGNSGLCTGEGDERICGGKDIDHNGIVEISGGDADVFNSWFSKPLGTCNSFNDYCDYSDVNRDSAISTTDAPNTGGALCRKETDPAAVCGDGISAYNEECDDGEDNTNEPSEELASGETYCDICELKEIPSICGNGITEGKEECDDGEGNVDDNPGCTEMCEVCSSDCMIEYHGPQCGFGLIASVCYCDGERHFVGYCCDDGGDGTFAPFGCSESTLFRFVQIADAHIITGGDAGHTLNDGRTDPSIYFSNMFNKYPEYIEAQYSGWLQNGVSTTPTTVMQQAVQTINNLEPAPDFAIFTGDNVADEGACDGVDKVTALDLFETMADGLTPAIPYYVLFAGYHDEAYDDDCQDLFVEKWGYLNNAFTKVNGASKNLFVSLSEVNGLGNGRNDMTYLANTLGDYLDQDYTLFLFVHMIPLNSATTGFTRAVEDTEMDSALQDYKSHFREIIVIGGHNHANIYLEENGIHYISTTALMNFPTEFRIFEIGDDKVYTRMSESMNSEIDTLSRYLYGRIQQPRTYYGLDEYREFIIDLDA